MMFASDVLAGHIGHAFNMQHFFKERQADQVT